MNDPLDVLCYPSVPCPDGQHQIVYGFAVIYCTACGEVLRAAGGTEREPNTHRCPNGCPPAPGYDFYTELCGQCLDQVYEDWAREIQNSE